MPFKSISSPRRVATLDAEIRGAAALSQPSIVAMVSTDPVRLAIQPSSGTAKIVNVSLSSADELAFLSKDVVVVRSGDEVWALLDIVHQPKMEQVARDIRALKGSPSGGGALCLGWDGSATALNLGTNEVVARSFALRGTARCIDVGATETWVIVDGGEGGELRIHPGATPEPGAKDRALLPRSAQKLDSLRSGKDLGIAYKRGFTEACVFVRGSGTVSPKMVRFRDAVLDVATVESSLIAAFADGRVELYDRNAIGSAGEGPIEATYATPLGQQGEPRSLLATGQGSASLWIGTSAGGVLQASLVRKNPL